LGFERAARQLPRIPTRRLTFALPPTLRVSAGKSGVGGGEWKISSMQVSCSFFCRQAIGNDGDGTTSLGCHHRRAGCRDQALWSDLPRPLHVSCCYVVKGALDLSNSLRSADSVG